MLKNHINIFIKLFVYNLTRKRFHHKLVRKFRTSITQFYSINFQNFPHFSIAKSKNRDDSGSYVGVINSPRAHGYFIRAAKAASRPPPPPRKIICPRLRRSPGRWTIEDGANCFFPEIYPSFRSQSECISPVNPIVLNDPCLSAIDRPAQHLPFEWKWRDFPNNRIVEAKVSFFFLLAIPIFQVRNEEWGFFSKEKTGEL